MFCKYLSANLFVSVFVVCIAIVSLSSEVFVLIVTNGSTNRPTRRHTKVRARDHKEKLTALQYYNTGVAILQSERKMGKKWGNNSERQARKTRFCEENRPKIIKNAHFIEENGLKKHLPKRNLNRYLMFSGLQKFINRLAVA